MDQKVIRKLNKFDRDAVQAILHFLSADIEDLRRILTKTKDKKQPSIKKIKKIKKPTKKAILNKVTLSVKPTKSISKVSKK